MGAGCVRKEKILEQKTIKILLTEQITLALRSFAKSTIECQPFDCVLARRKSPSGHPTPAAHSGNFFRRAEDQRRFMVFIELSKPIRVIFASLDLFRLPRGLALNLDADTLLWSPLYSVQCSVVNHPNIPIRCHHRLKREYARKALQEDKSSRSFTDCGRQMEFRWVDELLDLEVEIGPPLRKLTNLQS